MEDDELFDDNPFFIKNKYAVKTTKLGQGSYGAVYKSSKNDGTPIAIKVSNLKDIEAFNTGLKEIPNLAKLQDSCPNVVKYLEFHADFDSANRLYTIYLSMEYAEEGSLKDYLKKLNKPLPEEEVIKLAKDIFQALLKMKEKDMVHLDIKSANILCFPSSKGEICYKLADLAGAQKLGAARGMTNATNKQLIYTQGYCAPGFEGKKKDADSDFFYKADIFSLGITLLESCGIEPSKQEITKSSYDEYRKRIKLDNYQKIKDLLLGMIDFDEKKRITLEGALRKIEEALRNRPLYQDHPFFVRNKYLPHPMEFKGKGTYAEVYKVYKEDKKTEVAIKISSGTSIDDFNDGLKEITNQVRLQDVCPNIVKCYDFYAESSPVKGQPILNFKIFLSMEYAHKGSLKDYLKENDKRLPKDQVHRVARDTLEALKMMKEREMAHLDIKSANILCFKEDSGIRFKLADWAGAQKLTQTGMSRVSQKTLLITQEYCAPEVLTLDADELAKVNCNKADLFSLGITLLECCGVDPPKKLGSKENHRTFVQALNLEKYNVFKELFLEMIEYEPAKRITVERAIEKLNKIISFDQNTIVTVQTSVNSDLHDTENQEHKKTIEGNDDEISKLQFSKMKKIIDDQNAEIRSFKEEIENLRKRIDQKENEISRLKNIRDNETRSVIVEKLVNFSDYNESKRYRISSILFFSIFFLVSLIVPSANSSCSEGLDLGSTILQLFFCLSYMCGSVFYHIKNWELPLLAFFLDFLFSLHALITTIAFSLNYSENCKPHRDLNVSFSFLCFIFYMILNIFPKSFSRLRAMFSST